MAYDPNQEENKNQQGQASPLAAPPTSSGPGAGPGSSAGKSAPQATPAQPFQNLQAYLGANAPQVNQQASNIASNLGTQYGQVKSDIDKGTTDFGNQVTSGYAPANTDLTGRAASNPSEFISNPNDVTAFKQLYNDAYTGPNNFETSDAYGNLNGAVNKAVNSANLVNSTGGLQTYFQGQNPNATKGGNILDTVLLQGTPEAYETVKSAAQPFNTLADYLSGAVNTADAGVQNAKDTAQGISQGLQNQFTGPGGVVPTWQQTLEDELTGARNTATTRLGDVQNAFKGTVGGITLPNGYIAAPSQVSDQALADMGLTRSEYTSIANKANTLARGVPNTGSNYDMSPMDLMAYLTAQNPEVNITPTNTPTAEEYAKDAALAQLTGGNPNLTDVSQAGKANLDLSDVNTADLIRDLTENYNTWMAAHPTVQPISY